MSQSTKGITPLRQRMIEDMRMRKFSPKTQNAYIRAVRRFAAFLGRSPDSASDEDLRRYQLHLVVQGISPISLNATITGLKFFFEFTLGDPERMAKMTPVHVPHKLPVYTEPRGGGAPDRIGREPDQAELSVAYGAGLRASEVIALKVVDIDSQHGPARRAGQGPAEHIKNVLSRLKEAPPPETVETALTVAEAPVADTGRYDRLHVEVGHA